MPEHITVTNCDVHPGSTFKKYQQNIVDKLVIKKNKFYFCTPILRTIVVTLVYNKRISRTSN